MKRNESKFGILFRHWILANGKNLMSSTYELKDSAGKDSIPFSCLEDHQIDFSMAIKWGDKGCLIRVEAGNIGAPDYVFFRNSPAYVVVKYPKQFSIIDIETWTEEKKRSKRKSLTQERAEAISWRTIKL